MTEPTSQPGSGTNVPGPHTAAPSAPGESSYAGDQGQPQQAAGHGDPAGHGQQQPAHNSFGQPPAYGDPNSYGQPPAYGDPNGYGQPPVSSYGQQGFGAQGQGQPQGYGSGVAQAYGQPGYGPAAYGQPMPVRNDYATWGQRVGSYLIDMAPTIVGQAIFLVGYLAFIIDLSNTGATSAAGVVPMVIGSLIMLAALGWNIYNRWIVAGRTGQSLGRRVLKIYLVSEETNQPIGALNAFLRDLVHAVDGVAYVGYLWPLWDEKKQTFSDKIMKTAVIDPAKAGQH